MSWGRSGPCAAAIGRRWVVAWRRARSGGAEAASQCGFRRTHPAGLPDEAGNARDGHGGIMTNEFRGTGNVGEEPLLRTVRVGDTERQLAQLRVFFDESHKDAAGQWVRAGGFWLEVNVWGGSHPAEVAQFVRKGARIHVVGRLAEHHWRVTATGEERRAMQVEAEQVFLSLGRLEEARFKPKREAAAEDC